MEFLSGAVVVASLTADRNGAYHLTGLAPRATYSVRYSDVKASVTCGGPFNTADALDASVPRLGACPERDRKNLSWEQAAPLSSGQAVTDSLCQPNQSRWFKMAVAPAQIVTVELGKAPGEYRVALFKDLRSVAADLHQKAGDIASGKVEPTLLDAGMGAAAAAPWESSPWESSPWESSPWESSPWESSPWESSPSDSLVYSAAQVHGLLAVSAHGLIVRNTWENSGEYYIRVYSSGTNVDPGRPFAISARNEGTCGGTSDANGGQPLKLEKTAPRRQPTDVTTTPQDLDRDAHRTPLAQERRRPDSRGA